MKRIFLLLSLIAALTINAFPQSADLHRSVVIAITERITGLDTLSNAGTYAAAERIRELIYNSLVKKNEKFEYAGELADYKIGEDNLTVTFTLKDDVKFHDGKILTSADVKYTFDALFQANGAKAGSFYDFVPDKANPGPIGKREAHLRSIEAPDERTIVFRVARSELVNQLLSNLVAIPIIPEDTIERQNDAPVGTGAFRFVRFDQEKSAIELEAFAEYWEGAPKIGKLTIKSISDADDLQRGLLSDGVDVAANPTILSLDELTALGSAQRLKVERFPGSNIQYIGFNTKAAPFNNVKVRRAVAYAIDREKIISKILEGHAGIAHSILPEESWAYAPGIKYDYDPAKARRLLKEAGYKGKIVKLSFYMGNQTLNRQAQVIQSMLKNVGFNIEMETMEPQTLILKLIKREFQMNIGTWIGGNQDPVFYRDLFASANFPERKINGRNRARYSNPEFDKIIEQAARTTDKAKAKQLYARAQEIVSRDVPLLPLWYPPYIVIANKRIKNVNIKPGGDWSFVRFIEVAD